MTTTEANAMRVLLVDDERLARKRLRALLNVHPDVAVVGEAGDLTAARLALREHKPDVVFLDIQLPPENGFDLLPALPAGTEVVFVTAHDAYAVRAFEANAVDYLLKPVLPARLAATLGRLRAAWRQAASHPQGHGRLRPRDPVLVRDGRTWRKLEAGALAAIQGEGSYTRLFTTHGESLLILRSLNQWTDLLPAEIFARLSRSIMVNLQQIERCESIDRNCTRLYLQGVGQPLQLGRVAARQLRRRLLATGES